ncbi:MAG: rod shape-determining protein RodA [Desulfotomaculaceae bacterium]|nr:rod shape-determining protein RodA [Desulfotomaculaceae bacterium]
MLEQNILFKKLDRTLLIAITIIILLGLVIIYSATKPSGLLPVAEALSTGDDPFAYVKKQMFFVLFGIGMMIMMLYIQYEDLLKHVKFLYVLNLIILGAVLIVGDSTLGAQRWIAIGPNQIFRFQPSEFSKLLIIICFAAYLNSRSNMLNRLRDLLPCFVYIGVPALLILMQPDLGTALVFLAIMFGMLFIAGARPWLLSGIIAGGIGTASLWIWAHFWLAANRGFELWIPIKDYQLKRLVIFLDPWQEPFDAGYNVIQSQIAIGQGGFWGRGLFNGSQTYGDFLPFQKNDFIFSVVGEELGFIGAFLLLVLFFVVIYRGILIAINARDRFGSLLATGIVSMLVVHVLINVGMNIGIMPVTGIPLPMFSYGGSSMITNLTALGLLLNINMRRKKILF